MSKNIGMCVPDYHLEESREF